MNMDEFETGVSGFSAYEGKKFVPKISGHIETLEESSKKLVFLSETLNEDNLTKSKIDSIEFTLKNIRESFDEIKKSFEK